MLVDIGAEVWGRIPARLFGDSAALLAREEVDLGMQLDAPRRKRMFGCSFFFLGGGRGSN